MEHVVLSDEEKELLDGARKALLKGVRMDAENGLGERAKFMAEAYVALHDLGRDKQQ